MADLSVSRKNLSKLFTEMQGKKYIIPEFQRPYQWDQEKCETLWVDITDFFIEKNSNDEYFLGTIVTCEVDKNKSQIEIIDGQQRITSILLLLRAFYKKLENMPEDENILGLRSQIAPCIWDVDPISRKVKDTTQIHIESRVATEKDNEIFHKILETGTTEEGSEDLYSLNYNFLLSKCNEYARDNPINWQGLCVTILEKCIILPIECEKQDTALTIFSTLNDRGLPLSDSDIFKAQLYKMQSSDSKRNEFTDEWRILTETVANANVSLDFIFRNYSHVIRAKNEDVSKEIGLRKFYSHDHFLKLKDENLINDLKSLSYFWFAINKRKTSVLDKEIINFEASKYLHCLQCYPNEYWKYITSIFYLKNKEDDNFIEIFPNFLAQLIAFLFIRFIEKPTVNAIKDEIYIGGINVLKKKNVFNKVIDSGHFTELIKSSNSSKISKALILLQAYQNKNQTNLIPEDFEIEHIFPKAWQDTNYNGWDKKDADAYLEKFGNKTPIEKRINVQAGNGYFGKKKIKYKNSVVADVKLLSEYEKGDWTKEDIIKRENANTEKLIKFFVENLK